MLIGVPKEIKNNEFRVGLTPASVHELIEKGHRVLVESNAGMGIQASDSSYTEVGAEIVDNADTVFSRAELVVKVKEPQAIERQKLSSGQILFTYLHLAPDIAQTADLIQSGATCIAYETITAPTGGLPLLAPMSEVAGRMSVQAAAHHLEKTSAGSGMLLGGVPGVLPAKVVIIGGGTVGRHAAAMAIGLGADVTVLERSPTVLKQLWEQFGSTIKTAFSSTHELYQQVLQADVVIGGVLIPGAAAPKLVSAEMVAQMKPGSVVVDVAIDQGGCFETSRATTHESPVYLVDDVVHYCVANMPGAVPKTSTYALNNATLPYVLALADKGLDALRESPHFRQGLNVFQGRLTIREVAENQNLDYLPASAALGI